MRRVLLCTAVVAVIVFAVPTAAGAAKKKTMDITDCGVSVPHGTNAVLQTDIADCKPAFNANGITLAAGDAIDLNGHTIHYDDTLNGNAPIVCTGNCTVSNGTIVQDFQPFGVGSAIEASSKAHVTAHDVTFTNLANGVNVSLGTVDLKNVSMTVSDKPCAAQHFGSDGLPCECDRKPVRALLHSSGQSVHLCEYHIECFWSMWLGFRDAVRDLWPLRTH